MSRGARRGGVGGPPRHLPTAILTLALLAPAAEGQLRWDGGVTLSVGRYVFTERTHTVVVDNGVGVAWGGRVDLSLQLPVVAQNSALVSAVGQLRLPTGGPDHRLVERRRPGGRVPTRPRRERDASSSATPAEDSAVVFSGEFRLRVGDPTARLSVELLDPTAAGSLRSFRVGAGVKAPLTALEDGVGTGAWDASAGIGVTAALGRTLLSAAASWAWYGDLPEMALDDGLSGLLALSRPLWRERLSAMVSATAAQSPIAGMGAPVGVGLGLGWLGASGRILTLSASWGLTESMAGLSVGLGWSVPL